MPISIRIKRGVGGAPTTLLRGELAFDEDNQRLYIGKGDSGSDDANGLPIAQSIVELTTPPFVLADLADISVGPGASDGDVLVYDNATGDWVAEALSIAWDDVTSKPASFAPSTHASSHHTGGGDAIAPADIGAAAATHSHAWGDITSGVPSDFTPTAHKASHATGGTDALSPSDIGAAAASHTHSDATTSVAGFLSASDKTKLDGIASGATANAGTVTSVTAGDGLSGGTVDTSGTIAVDLATDPGLEFSSGKLRAKVGAGLKRDSNGIGIALAAVNPGLVANQDGFAVDFGTSAAEVAAGNHGHGNITTAGAIGSTSGLPVKTGASGVLEAGAFGTSAGEFAEGNHTHAWTDITSKPSDFTPSAHNHTVTLEMCGLIESPEAKTYIISPAIPAAITITNVKAKTSEGTVDIKLQDDGVDITNTTIGDVGTSVAAPGTAPSASVAADSVLALVVSDLQTSPKNLAFTIHYTVTSANNS